MIQYIESSSGVVWSYPDHRKYWFMLGPEIFQAVCRCGWEDRTYGSLQDANRGYDEHLEESYELQRKLKDAGV